MTCKDCLHNGVCGGFTPTDLDRDVFDYCRDGRTDEIPDIEERCNHFQNKSRFIEVPCKVGDKVYVPAKWINGILSFVIVRCDIYEEEMFFEDDSFNMLSVDDFGKTVFLTREEAEKALAEEKRK